MIAGIAASIIVTVLVRANIFLQEILSPHAWLGLVSIMWGSEYFGQWLEKRKPGVLNNERIKKIALWSSVINFILIAGVFYALVYIDYLNGKPGAFTELGIPNALIVFCSMLVYFSTKSFIARGVKKRINLVSMNSSEKKEKKKKYKLLCISIFAICFIVGIVKSVSDHRTLSNGHVNPRIGGNISL